MSAVRVGILDYGIGNVKSISNALEHIGAEPVLSSDRSTILETDALILPGVGAFSAGMKNLESNQLLPLISEFVSTGKPFLGICLGMQMLMEESEEFGMTKGLGLIKGKVVRMPVQTSEKIKLPHVSWSSICEPSEKRWTKTILENTAPSSDMYFVHTFVAAPQHEEDILAVTEYNGVRFCSAVQHANVFGTQFHPEKSGTAGLSILKKFTQLANKK